MKKLTALISALTLLLSLCACSSQAGGPGGEDSQEAGSAASQAVNEGQNIESDKEPPVTPVGETGAPKTDEEPQPPAGAPETSAPVPETARPSRGGTASVGRGQVPAGPETPPAGPAQKPENVPAPSPEQEPAPAADPKTTAQGLIGRPVSELYAAIGQPISSDYAPGCLEPDSEDGELIYSGFTVYTVRTATREYVYDVL